MKNTLVLLLGFIPMFVYGHAGHGVLEEGPAHYFAQHAFGIAVLLIGAIALYRLFLKKQVNA